MQMRASGGLGRATVSARPSRDAIDPAQTWSYHEFKHLMPGEDHGHRESHGHHGSFEHAKAATMPAAAIATMAQKRPSHEDVHLAQSHLVLLKSKMRQQRLGFQQTPSGRGRGKTQPAECLVSVHSLKPPQDGGGPGGVQQHPQQLLRGRFEPIPHANVGGASPGGLGRPREAPRTRGPDQSPRGVTWDPPCALQEAAPAQTPERAPTHNARLGRGGPGRGGARRPVFVNYQSGGYPIGNASLPVDNSGTIDTTVGLTTFNGGLSRGSPVALPEEQNTSGEPLVPCPECGRKFVMESLEKHTRICKKVFLQRRKQFDSAANRLGDLENSSALVANAHKLEKEKEQGNRVRRRRSGGEENVPKWKLKSLAFREAILAAKAAAGDETAQMKATAIQQTLDAAGGADSDMTRCPHCSRTFNKEAGERHIAICVKTFGNKPGGGRLIKGGGRVAAAGAVANSTAKPLSVGSAAAAIDRRISQEAVDRRISQEGSPYSTHAQQWAAFDTTPMSRGSMNGNAGMRMPSTGATAGNGNMGGPNVATRRPSANRGRVGMNAQGAACQMGYGPTCRISPGSVHR